MIPGMDTPKERSYLVEPKKYAKFLKKIEYEIEPFISKDRKKTFENVERVLKKRFKTVKKFLRQNFDFFIFLIRATDVVQHFFWSEEDKILKIYEQVDKFFPELRKRCDTLFVISDHGFGEARKCVNLNSYLIAKGYLSLKRPALAHLLLKLKVTRRRVANILNKFGVLRRRISTQFLAKVGRKIPPERGIDIYILFSHNLVDWKKTKAIAIGCSIYLNSRSKFVRGVMDEEECELLKSKLKEEFSLLFEKNNLNIQIREFEEVFPQYGGETCPDLMFVPMDETIIFSTLVHQKIIEPVKESTHYLSNGIFIVYGRGVRGGLRVNAEIYDIAPTVLHLLGLPISNNMDGKVLTEICRKRKRMRRVNPSYYLTEREKIQKVIPHLSRSLM
jgi:predicted AlkP superfamily phosphohydrolase/phosphomutase